MSALGEGSLIVTPTYNERASLPVLIEAVHAEAPAAHVLVVDDGSPDGTGELADQIARDDARVSVLHRSHKLGLGTAYVAGFREGLRRGFERFVQMDADLSHDPRALAGFFAALDAGADVVIGARWLPGGRIVGWGPGRLVLSRGGSLYAKSILGLPFSDLTSGYKALSRRALEVVDLGRVRSNGYSFQIELTYRAVRRGLSVVEIPIEFVDRNVGQSKMDARVFAEAVGLVWRLRYQAWRGGL